MVPAPVPASPGGNRPRPMKLLVFAHRPPPLHGQSQLVSQMLDGFARRPELGVECHHVDARISTDLANVGRAGGAKLWRLSRYVMQARRIQRRERCDAFYYIPAPGQRNPLYRDWLALPWLRAAFPRTIFQWHASGLATWLREQARPWERNLSWRILGNHELSIVNSCLSDPALVDFHPRSLLSVHNGIADPTAGGDVPVRVPVPGRLLFLGLCCREKGLFDALEAVALLNRNQAVGSSPVTYHLDIGGAFPDEGVRAGFDRRVAQPDLAGAVTYHGFAGPAEKARLFAAAEAFVFPSYYGPEAMPLVLLEAMAWSVPIVTTRWRALPEYLPPGYPGIVPIQRPDAVAEAVRKMIAWQPGAELRRHFLREYTLERHLENLATALRSVLNDPDAPAPHR